MHVPAALLSLGVAFASPAAAPPDAPRVVVRHAVVAVEGDSVEVVRCRWAKAAAADTPDRSAVLGLATIARLTYSYATADSLFATLTSVPGQPSDDITVYALIGSAQAARSRGALMQAEGFASR